MAFILHTRIYSLAYTRVCLCVCFSTVCVGSILYTRRRLVANEVAYAKPRLHEVRSLCFFCFRLFFVVFRTLVFFSLHAVNNSISQAVGVRFEVTGLIPTISPDGWG